MRSQIAAWLDAHANPEWHIFHQEHSTQLLAAATTFWAIVAGIWVALPAFIDRIPAPVFLAISIAFSLAIAFCRFTKQPGLPDV